MKQDKKIILSVDLMGGDLGPRITLAGVSLAAQAYGDLRFILHGRENEVLPLLKNYPNLDPVSEFKNAEIAIDMAEKPSQAVRRGRKNSSMGNGILDVKYKKADACVSAGNTGALMALSKVFLNMIPQVDRPGIAGIWPSLKGEKIVLDIGASIGASSKHLVNLAIMGSGMYRVLYGSRKPRVGLLNIGIEDVKGLEEIKEASELIKNSQLKEFEYIGFLEGNDIGKGAVDVVVTEGFVGNIALKTAEGTARQVSSLLNEEIRKSWVASLGYLLARKAFKAAQERMNPERVNGGVLLGLDGLVVKSHGSTSEKGFFSALGIARKMVVYNLLNKVKKNISQIHNQ